MDIARIAPAAGLLALLVPSAAHAFCGHYVGPAGAELTSGASQVVLARQGERTVLTFANDYEGDLREFALVVPVPKVLAEGDVEVVDPVHLERISEYVAPRLVEYSCEDFAHGEWGGSSRGCGCNMDDGLALDRAPSAAEDSLDVDVEATFSAGEYDIVILSSEDSADLVTWLTREGYGVSEAAEDLLGEYIDSGAFFFAAKVRLDDVPVEPGPEGRPFLSPLQIRYEESTVGLPIRLGTLNSPGTQDLLVTTLTDVDRGSMGIANYPEVTLDDECLWDEDRHGSLDGMIEADLDAAVDEAGGAAWLKAYSWGAANCDPCPPGGALEDEIVQVFGFEGPATEVHATRLWMRYRAEAVTTDLAFYETGESWEMEQLRYIVHKTEIEQRFPICGEGFAEDPGTCDDAEAATERRRSSAPWLPVGLIVLGTLGGTLLRRRSSR